jgi:hypothetical protein
MPRLGWFARRGSRAALYDVAPPMHLRFFSDQSLRSLETCLGGELSLRQLHQTHGKIFHIGHLFKPEWYQVEDVFPVTEGEVPSRVVIDSPSTLWEQNVFRLLDVSDWILTPLTQAIDGQRVLHAIWQKPL